MEVFRNDKVAILFGAETSVGEHCLKLLLQHQAYRKVIVFAARPLPLENERLRLVSIKVLRSGELQRISGDDLFYCTNGFFRQLIAEKDANTAELSGVLPVAKLALAGRVNQFLVLSSAGADTEAMMPLARMKGQIAQVLSRMSFWSVHVFKTSPVLYQPPPGLIGQGLFNMLRKKVDLLKEGVLGDFHPIEEKTVAAAMVSAAQGMAQGYFEYNNDQMETLSNSRKTK